ncbi:MAG: hypothetical protein U9Q83_09700 [Bacteroidota bacterium]|nr:hypothetical protein [Bacteroidota bacterium]
MVVLVVILSVSLISCITTKTQVGQYQSQTGDVYKYSKGKQVWALWGIIPVGRTSVNTPADGNCEIVSRYNAGDVLISGLTAGIIMTRTIKVNAKK